MKPEAPIVVRPFAFGDSKDQPTEMSVVFEMDGKIYTYEFELNSERILVENWKRTSFVKEKMGTQKVFSRTWNASEKHYDLDGENFNLRRALKTCYARMQASSELQPV